MRRKIVFPDVESANEDGLVAVGGELDIDTILTAYRKGIFPWPLSSWPLNANLPHTWFSPDPRGILDFKDLHVSRSFIKFLKKTPYHVTFNQAFELVIHQCAVTVRRDQPGTWITPDIIEAYTNLFHEGHAYSVEVWDGELLVGGLYGVIMGNFISGESMFTTEDNASKQGLYALMVHLEDKGIHFLDTQMVTNVVKQFGGRYITRREFIKRLDQLDWTRKRDDVF